MSDRDLIEQLLERVVISDGAIEVALKHQGGAAGCASDFAQTRITVPFWTRNTYARTANITVAPETEPTIDGMRAKTRRTLLQSIVNARRWANDLTAGRVSSVNAIAKRDGCSAYQRFGHSKRLAASPK